MPYHTTIKCSTILLKEIFVGAQSDSDIELPKAGRGSRLVKVFSQYNRDSVISEPALAGSERNSRREQSYQGSDGYDESCNELDILLVVCLTNEMVDDPEFPSGGNSFVNRCCRT